MNKIEKEWDDSTFQERDEFLKILDKRYNFGRICVNLLGKENCFYYRKLAGIDSWDDKGTGEIEMENKEA